MQLPRETRARIREMPKDMNIRVSVNDLTAACRALGEVHVLAAGSMYATLHLNSEQLGKLIEAKISWGLD